MLPVAFRRRLQVTHQARIEDIDDARAKYAELSIAAELATYLPDMPEQLAWTHLVIARAGASTIAALTAAGRPAILAIGRASGRGRVWQYGEISVVAGTVKKK